MTATLVRSRHKAIFEMPSNFAPFNAQFRQFRFFRLRAFAE